MRKLKNKGFGLVEGLMIFVVVALVAGIGWYVLKQKSIGSQNAQSDSAQANTQQDQENITKKQVPAQDETSGWIAYTSKKGQFSLRYPNSWKQPTNKDMCTASLFDRTLYLGHDSDHVLKCGTEYFGEVSVYSVSGDKRSQYKLSAQEYKDIKTEDVTVDGVIGVRTSGVTYNADPNDPFAPANGTKEVKYTFYSNGITYGARYTKLKSDKDVTSDFDLMITKTLTFK